MMRMLDALQSRLDEIEKKNDWAYRFVSDLLIRVEENPDYKLTGKQFKKLNEIYEEYI